MAGVSLSTVLRLIGGVPLMRVIDAAMIKNPVLGPGLKAMARNIALPVPSMMSMVTDALGTIQNVLQNPVSAALSLISAQLPVNVAHLKIAFPETQETTGGGSGGEGGDNGGGETVTVPSPAQPLIDAIEQNLDPIISELRQVTNMYSGLVEPPEGSFGLMDVSAHMGLEEVFENLPATMAVEKVLGPLNMKDPVAAYAAEVDFLTTEVINQRLTIDYATGVVQQMAAEIEDVIFEANRALSAAQSIPLHMGNISSAVSLLTSTALAQELGERIIRPQYIDGIRSEIAELTAPPPASEVDLLFQEETP